MHHKKSLLCVATAVLAVAVACSKSAQSPAAPSGAIDPASGAAADGSTLKVTAPTPVSPINGAQPDTLTLVATAATGKYGSVSPSYEFQIATSGGATVAACSSTVASVTYTPTCTLEFDTPYTWRVRAVVTGAVGPWSSAASFRTQSGGYIRGSEVFDPLTNGKTVGIQVGGTQFIAGQGIELLGHDSRVTYGLPETLQAGEFSVMVKGIDEGSPGDKTKVISMQEGFGNDITDNDYRFTLEKRGRLYSTPGAVTWRIIMGEADEHAGRIFDGDRIGVAFSDERWYFWKASWGNGRCAVEVREDSPTGRVIYSTSRGTGGFAYRPVPHVVHLGSPVGRAGPNDASIPGAIYKNVWVSSRPRPNFPGIADTK